MHACRTRTAFDWRRNLQRIMSLYKKNLYLRYKYRSGVKISVLANLNEGLCFFLLPVLETLSTIQSSLYIGVSPPGFRINSLSLPREIVKYRTKFKYREKFQIFREILSGKWRYWSKLRTPPSASMFSGL